MNSRSDDEPSGAHESIWMADTEGPSYPPLEDDASVDVAVVGGGIAGVTAARHLKDAGLSVAVIESNGIGSGTTGRSTAKLTSQHGLVYRDLISDHGEDRAWQYARANEAAIDEVESRVDEHGIDCDFQRTEAYTYTTDAGGRSKVSQEVEAAKRLGLPASYTETTDLPYEVEAAVEFKEQARFDPRAYVVGLAETIPGDGSHVYEGTKATGIERGRRPRVETDRGTVAAEDVVVATLFPFYDRGLYFSRLTPKQSYVLAVRLAGGAPQGMYYRDGDPYFSVRPHPTGEASTVLVGGQNHRTGHGHHAMEKYRKLEAEARRKFDVEAVTYRWSTQDFVSADGVPFVGKLAPQTDHVYVATGFGGWGLTNGTAAGRLIADLVTGRENDWQEVYRPTRLPTVASARALVDHNAKAARHFLEDHLRSPRRPRLGELGPDEAAVVDGDDGPVAAYRDDDGEVHAVSAVCTHLSCNVQWNDAERTWDCPCHGSRFGYDGAVVDGPAADPLPEADVRERLGPAGEGLGEDAAATDQR